MTSTTKTLGVQQQADGIVHETETTSVSVRVDETITRAWLDGDRVHLAIGHMQSLTFAGKYFEGHADNYAPEDAEHLAKLLLDLAQQARAVQARKPWTGGSLTNMGG